MYGLATARVGEGHVATDDPSARPGMSAQEIVDRLGWLKGQGVTMSAVPFGRTLFTTASPPPMKTWQEASNPVPEMVACTAGVTLVGALAGVTEATVSGAR